LKVEDALRMLSNAERRRLEWSFEAGTADFVIKRDGLIIGVYLHQIDHLEIIEKEGIWATARQKDE
jgi:hypothetical protein